MADGFETPKATTYTYTFSNTKLDNDPFEYAGVTEDAEIKKTYTENLLEQFSCLAEKYWFYCFEKLEILQLLHDILSQIDDILNTNVNDICVDDKTKTYLSNMKYTYSIWYEYYECKDRIAKDYEIYQHYISKVVTNNDISCLGDIEKSLYYNNIKILSARLPYEIQILRKNRSILNEKQFKLIQIKLDRFVIKN
jgi:hypothetical protein